MNQHFVKKLPKTAKFDFTDIFGGKHYHSTKRKYTVYRNKILSEEIDDTRN